MHRLPVGYYRRRIAGTDIYEIHVENGGEYLFYDHTREAWRPSGWSDQDYRLAQEEGNLHRIKAGKIDAALDAHNVPRISNSRIER